MNELYKILNLIKQNKFYPEYTEFLLNSPLIIRNIDIHKLEKQYVCKISINKKTYLCDNIGVVDLSGTRYIDFDDNIWTMMNKGLL